MKRLHPARGHRGGQERQAAARADERGFTLIEVTVMLLFAALMMLTLQSSMLSTVKTRQRTHVTDVLQAQAHEFLQRLLVIPFGAPGDPAATADQLTELFDDDADLGNVTLRQVSVAPAQPGHTFATTRDGVTTQWRVAISNDLDGDGVASGFREGRPDLLAIEVFANDRLMFRTMRAADFANTRRD
ncbi:MAG: hypothetical protein IT458_06990 [Planctomycetes bacterium]|nr:hypothetical protein [Planctomycetota bacterium]